VALIYARTVFEEEVLSEAFPEYAAYRARVKRFIPGVI
jgi:protein-S-isoprenylcysteine O-methyltransferase Ste14